MNAPEEVIERALHKSIEWTSPQSRAFMRMKCTVEVDNTAFDSFQNVRVVENPHNVFAQAIALFCIVAKRTPELSSIDSVVVYDKTVPILCVRMKSEKPVRVLAIDIHNFQRHLAIENDVKTSTNRQYWFVGIWILITCCINLYYYFTSTTSTATYSPKTFVQQLDAMLTRSGPIMNLLHKFT
jgi:hypothetical protein